MNQWRLVVPIAVILFAGTGISVAAQSSPTQRTPDTITVTGNATVNLPPDQAEVTGSVQTQADTAGSAADQNSRSMQAVVDAVQALGITPDNIVTSGFNVAPQYSYTQPEAGQATPPPVIAGYQASQSVTVTTKQLSQAAGILQAMAQAGATNLGGPNYQLQHPEQLQVQAEQQASANALQRAQAIASGLGIQLGGDLSVNEGGAVYQPFPLATPAAQRPPFPAPPVPTAAPVAPPPVFAPSSLSASATITVVFAILNTSGGS